MKNVKQQAQDTAISSLGAQNHSYINNVFKGGVNYQNSNRSNRSSRKKQQSRLGSSVHRGIPMLVQRHLAVIMLVLVSPVILVVSVLLRIESRGPVIFCQTRVGKYGRYFKMYKFRSMFHRNDSNCDHDSNIKSDREGICEKCRNDPRVTRVGRFIRKYSLDELPQLINVIKGDMMLVGPRPALVSEFLQYEMSALRRLDCLPGITGLWQVSGRADIDFDEQLLLDLQYINEQSISTDIKILMATVPAVISAEGAY